MRLPRPPSSESPPSPRQPPRCAACQDVIGVYEPLVEVLRGLARRTSRAAEPGIAEAGGDVYHAHCYGTI